MSPLGDTEQAHRIRQRLTRLLGATIGATLSLLLVVTWLVFFRIPHVEHEACSIQSRGLVAGKHFVPVMEGINEMLTPVPTKEAHLPPAITDALVKIRYHLPIWLGLQAQQPGHRSC